MKRLATVFTAMVAIALVAGCGNGTSSGKVLVDINGNKITEGDIDFLGKINPRIQAQITNPAGKKRILDNLVEQELLYQEAVKEGINRDPDVKAKVELYRRVIIAQSLVDKDIEKAAKKYYDENSDEFKKLQLSVIMIKYASPDDIKDDIKKDKKSKKKSKQQLHTEQEALDIAQKLKAKIDGGEDFAKAARESSEDVATKSRGGDLGLVSRGDKRLVNRGLEVLIDKAFELKVGEVGGPVKTPKGYCLIKVTRGIEPETFDEAKQEIILKIRGDARNDLMARLKKEATIVYSEEDKAKEEAKKKAEEHKGKAKEDDGQPKPPITPPLEKKDDGKSIEGMKIDIKEEIKEKTKPGEKDVTEVIKKIKAKETVEKKK